MMNRRSIFLVAVTLAVILMLGSLTLAQAGKDQGGAYAIQIEAAAGGRYHLDGGGWQVQGAAAGGGYHLAGIAGPAGGGTPCCCFYLPCTLRGE
jgi:hypothetical protein